METFEWTWKSTDSLEMYSRGWTPGGEIKAVVCLVHGLGEHIGRYAHVAAALGQHGYAFVGFDLRGHGKSGGRRGHTPSTEAYYDDIDLFLKQVEERFPGKLRFLYGHSLGGTLVLAYSPLRKPKIAGVIATAATLKGGLLEREKVKVALGKVLGSLLPTFTLSNGVDPDTLSRDPEVPRAYVNDPLVHNRATAGFGKVLLETIATAWRNAPDFPVPLLIMHGMKDELGYPGGSQDFAALVKDDCTLKLWDGLYHEIHNEPEKGEVFKFMINWLDKHLHS